MHATIDLIYGSFEIKLNIFFCSIGHLSKLNYYNFRRQEYQRATKESNGSYERWWAKQKNNPLGGSRLKYTESKVSFFGRSWLYGSDNTNIDGRTQNNVHLEKGVLSVIPAVAQEEMTEPPIFIMDLAAVDAWKCDCAVCTGVLLTDIYSVPNRNEHAMIKSRRQKHHGRKQKSSVPMKVVIKENVIPKSAEPKPPKPAEKKETTDQKHSAKHSTKFLPFTLDPKHKKNLANSRDKRGKKKW